MAVQWTLRKWLAAERGIYRATDLQRLILEQTGVHLSVQSVSSLMIRPPKAIRFRTIQPLCTALRCQLSDFCVVLPDEPQAGERPDVAPQGVRSDS